MLTRKRAEKKTPERRASSLGRKQGGPERGEAVGRNPKKDLEGGGFRRRMEDLLEQ